MFLFSSNFMNTLLSQAVTWDLVQLTSFCQASLPFPLPICAYGSIQRLFQSRPFTAKHGYTGPWRPLPGPVSAHCRSVPGLLRSVRPGLGVHGLSWFSTAMHDYTGPWRPLPGPVSTHCQSVPGLSRSRPVRPQRSRPLLVFHGHA